MLNTFRHFFRDEIAGRFLHRDLAFNRGRHVISVPMKTFGVMAIEEMHLTTGCPYIRMKPYKLEQGPGAAFFHADDQRLRQMSIRLKPLLAKKPIFR